MAWDPPSSADVNSDKPVQGPGGFGEKVKNSLDYLYGAIGSVGANQVQNGSFEILDATTGMPVSWTTSVYPGGSVDVDAGNAADGAYALKFTHPGSSGNGGGDAISEDLPCNESLPFRFNFLHKCSQSGVKVIIQIRYYTEAKVWISDETIYSETTNPTDWSPERSDITTIPATAQFCKIKLVGGYTDTDPGSSTDIWFDGTYITYGEWVKDRADTSVYNDNNVVFQDLDTNKDILIQFAAVGDNNAALTLQLSDDNGSTYEVIDGVLIKNGSSSKQTTSTIPLNSTSDEWIDGGYLHLIRLPDGQTRIDACLLTSADGGSTVFGSTILTAVCPTAVNCFKIYSAGNFDQAGASVSIMERSQ